LKAELLPAGTNLVETLLQRLKGDEKDFSGTLIVFPGKRPAHFVRKALAEKVRSSFIPPAILSMDEFVDSIYEKKAGRAGRRLEPIDAVAMLYELHRDAPRMLGGDHFLGPDAFFPVGTKIYGDIEELFIECVSPEELKKMDTLASEGIPPFARERLQGLSFFYEGFYRSAAARGYSTRSLRYRIVSEEIDTFILGNFDPIIFAGFFAFTRSEVTLFRKLLFWEKVFLICQDGPGIGKRLHDLGIEVGKGLPEEAPPEKARPEVHFYQSPDTHGQVFSLSALLEKMRLEKTPLDERTAIVLPSSETLFPLYHQTLSLIEEGNWNISMGYPLHRTPVYGFLNSLMELVSSRDGDRLYSQDYLKFVLHPYTKNISFKENAEITRILFHTLEERLTSAGGRTFVTLSDLEEDPGLFIEAMRMISKEGLELREGELKDHLREIHQRTIVPFLAFQNVRDFASKSSELLDYLFRRSTARFHPFFHPFAEAFAQSLDSLGRSLMGETVFERTTSYFAFFRKYILTCSTPFEGTPVRGIQVLGILETRNLSFDRVFVLDVNEEVLPDTRKEDSLLPFRVRQILGLPTYVERDQLSAYYFETLLAGGKEVHLFFVENDRKERSRFIERLLWEKQKQDRVLDPSGYFHKVQYQVSLRNRAPGEVPKTPEVGAFLKRFAFSATALDTYLRCPLAFYLRYVLGLERKDEIKGEIERTDIGRMVHSVLSQYFGKRKGGRLRISNIDLEEMDNLVESCFEAEFGEDPVGSAFLLKRQVRAHMIDYLSHYVLPLSREQEVRVLEVEYSAQAVHEGFSLTGRLDHIEKRDESTCIIDYKTSSRPDGLRTRFDKLDFGRRESWREAIGSLQLPFYLLLYSKAQSVQAETLQAMFLLLGRAAISRAIEIPLFDGSEGRREKFEGLKGIILSLLREIVDPAIPFHPTPDQKEFCPTCDFRHLCGAQWLVR
jgi:CRISPR/Cas system-associated exonuclease Cas4 (RecB family)